MAKITHQQQPDLAELLAAVMAHPDLPPAVRTGILEGLCELYMSDKVYESPEYLREILKLNAPRGKKGGKR